MSRKRNIQIIFWVSEKEHELIAQKMEQVGTDNLSAYLRKIAIDGFIIKLDLLCVRDYELLLGQIAADKIIGRVTLAPHAEQDYALVFQMVNQLLIHIQTSSLHIHQIFSE